jgi:putative NADH-flavin reductase
MKLLIVGATGRTGRELVGQGRERGHEVTALVRDPSAAGDFGGGVTISQGDVLDKASLSKAVVGKEVVLSALGNASNRRRRRGRQKSVLPTGMHNLVEAMQEAGARRLIILSAFGTGSSRDETGFVFNHVIRRIGPLANRFDERELMEEEVRGSKLEWVIVQPTRLTSGPGAGHWQVIFAGGGAAAKISRADVAAFMLDQVDSDEYLGQAPGITN